MIPYFKNKAFALRIEHPQAKKFIHNLINGRLNYRLVREFRQRDCLLFGPKADHVSPTILIFKKR